MTQELNAEPLTLSRLKRLKRSVYYSSFTVLPIKWALMDQALGIDRPRDGHRQAKRRALIARAVCTGCPNVWRFLGIDKSSLIALRLLNQHDTEPRYKKKVFCRNRRPYYFCDLQERSPARENEITC